MAEPRTVRENANALTSEQIATILPHRYPFALVDRILFMDGGVVVEQGPARQLIEHPQEERTRRFLAHYSE